MIGASAEPGGSLTPLLPAGRTCGGPHRDPRPYQRMARFVWRRPISAASRACPPAPIRTPSRDPLDHVRRSHLVQERDAGRPAGRQHASPGREHVGGVRRVVLRGMSHGEPHVPGPPLGERDPGHRQARLDVGESADVLDLEPEQELPAGIERPGIRPGHVLGHRQAPHRRRVALPPLPRRPTSSPSPTPVVW